MMKEYGEAVIRKTLLLNTDWKTQVRNDKIEEFIFD
jgi:hypothetical protein